MNQQHFGSDQADTRTRIRIYPEILILIRDYFWLRFDALADICKLYRFPALAAAAAGSKTDVALASRRRKGSTATTTSHSSTTTTRPNTRKGQQTVKSRPSADDDGGDPPVVAATTRGSDARRHPGDSDTDSQVCCKNADTNMERSCRPTRIINTLPNTSQIAVVLMIVTVNRKYVSVA